MIDCGLVRWKFDSTFRIIWQMSVMSPSPISGRAGVAAIRHRRGRRKNDCAIAALSMISGLPYDAVLLAAKRYGPRSFDGGVPTCIISRLLKDLTGAEWRKRKCWRRPYVSRMPVSSETSVWIIWRWLWWRRCCHAIVVDGEWIYDSALGAVCHRNKYPLARWRVASVFEAVGPVSATELCVARRIAACELAARN